MHLLPVLWDVYFYFYARNFSHLSYSVAYFLSVISIGATILHQPKIISIWTFFVDSAKSDCNQTQEGNDKIAPMRKSGQSKQTPIAVYRLLKVNIT